MTRTGVAVAAAVFAAVSTAALDAQSSSREMNDNYLTRNPFYFEGRVDYDLLGIDEPTDAWEFMQRGIHKQDEEDYEGAVKDYRRGLELNSLQNGTCQLVTEDTLVNGALPQDLTPAPCIFTLRLRLAYLIHKDEPEEAIRLFEEVLDIDPLRPDVNLLIAETWEVIAKKAEGDEAKVEQAYRKAIDHLRREVALFPPPDPSIAPDRASHPLAHWLLAHLHEVLEEHSQAIEEYELYLEATKWRSDTLPWRIPLARKKVEELRRMVASPAAIRATRRGRARVRN